MLGILLFFTTAFPTEGGKTEGIALKDVTLETKIFLFGEPMILNCEITKRTKTVSWWLVNNQSRISEEFTLSFGAVNHGHSGNYECVAHENEGFQVYSRKVLVVEPQYSIVINERQSDSIIHCQFKYVSHLRGDVYLVCSGARSEFNETKDIEVGMVTIQASFITTDAPKCYLGFDNSTLSIEFDHLFNEAFRESLGKSLKACIISIICVVVLVIFIIVAAMYNKMGKHFKSPRRENMDDVSKYENYSHVERNIPSVSGHGNEQMEHAYSSLNMH